MPNIHPTAIVDMRAELAEDVEVGPFAIIEADVHIDEGSVIHHHAFIGTGARIGKRCIVHHAAVVSNVPQDLKFKGTEKTYVEVGDDCTIREFATLHRATIHEFETNAGTLDGVTRVGRGSLIMAYAHIAHDCFVGEEVILSNSVQMAGHVSVESFAIIGGGCLIHQFSLVGSMVMIGGGAQIRKDIPPFALIGGEELKFSGINRVGLQRRGKSPDTIRAIKDAYKSLYDSGLNISDGLAKLSSSELAVIPEVQQIIHFVRSSRRGIVGMV
jgi:UDP-N-acetylglucosamine acyltransferase